MGFFENKVIVVTGGGRGIGAACAKLFASAGARVVIASRTQAELDRVAREISDSGARGTALAVVADVKIEASVQYLFKRALEAFGPVDALVNNAGAVGVRDFIDIEAADWDHVVAVNLRGAFLCSRELFRQVRASDGAKPKRCASIVNLSSLAGIRGTQKFKGLASYVASKHAVVGLTESLAVEGRDWGIRANCIAPGAVDTAMLREAAPFLKTETTPEDVARTVLFLSDETQSASLSGAVIEIHSNL